MICPHCVVEVIAATRLSSWPITAAANYCVAYAKHGLQKIGKARGVT